LGGAVGGKKQWGIVFLKTFEEGGKKKDSNQAPTKEEPQTTVRIEREGEGWVNALA